MGIFSRPDRNSLAESPQVDRFFDLLGHVDSGVLLAMSAAWRSEDVGAREAAWVQVNAVARRAGLRRGVEGVRDRAFQWAGKPGYTYAEITAYGGGEPIWNDARRQAAPAIVDAAVAVALGDRLDGASRDVLLGPWIRATATSD